MKIHSYWGKTEADWAGFSSGHTFRIKHFDKNNVEVFLGGEFDEDGYKIKRPPYDSQLDDFERIFKAFLNGLDQTVDDIREKAFDYYRNVYAAHYEKPFPVGPGFDTDILDEGQHQPLSIDNDEKHFEYMKDIIYIRIQPRDTIRIPIHYKLDHKHGMEIKLVNNRVDKIGRIAGT